MKILYDHQIFDYQEFGVKSRYFADVISHLPSACRPMVGVLETRNSYLSRMGFPLRGTTFNSYLDYRTTRCKRLRFRIEYSRRFGIFGKWDHLDKLNRGYTLSLLKQGDFDLAHLTSYDDSLLRYIGHKPFVVTVFDMLAESKGGNDDLLRSKRNLLKHAAGIITPDEATRHSVLSYYHVPAEKVAVVPFGIDMAVVKFSAQSPVRARYMVYVDNQRDPEQFGRLVEAFGDLTSERPNLKLVCLGPAFTEEEQTLIEGSRLSDAVIYINARSQKDVLNIYHHAEACVVSDVSSLCITRQADVKASGAPLLLFDGKEFVQMENDCSKCVSHQQTAEQLAEVYQAIAGNR